MPLQPPGGVLAGFPARRGPALRELYRIYRHRDHGGHVRSPWFFASTPPGDGRFDLPTPSGTCYWSDRRYGAWVEVFRGTLLVDARDASSRRLSTAFQVPDLLLADLRARRAYRFGITAAINSIVEYAIPQQWAAALHAAHFDGLIGTCSHDPSSTALNVAVFGHAGAFRTRPGWRTRSSRIETDATLLAELARLGVHTAHVPHTVDTIPAPP